MRQQFERWAYPVLLGIIYLSWLSYMVSADQWHLFAQWWAMSVTMVLGSFVAGATAEGGAAIAFPVFTKLLQIPSEDARTFGLMIQAVGMTTAGLVIITRRVKILPDVILWASIGGAIGMVFGSYFVSLPNPYPKLLFTFVTAAFGVSLIISRWMLDWNPRETLSLDSWPYRLLFIVIGFVGGTFAANTGSGTDTLTFIVLTLAFGINEKVSTPTTVIIMGVNSVVGFFVHGVMLQDIGIAWEYWLVCIPIVILGAPLGAWTASKLPRDAIIYLLLSLITLELVTTIWLIPFTPPMIQFVWVTVLISSCWFAGMLMYRYYYARPVLEPSS